MFDKLLIATRGEIAVRIARSCERLGVGTIAIFGEGEREALHVEICDEAVCVGQDPSHQPYLDVDAILRAATEAGASAIHPGYGPLSESPEFARAVTAAGMTFVGPPPDILELFADPRRAREVAHTAGVRALPCVAVELSDWTKTRAAADELGFPLRVIGGDGDQETVQNEDDLAAAVARLERSDAGQALLERSISRPRRVLVQLLADAHGQCASVGEREGSIETLGMKLIEESPAPAFSSLPNGELKREILADIALRVAKEGGYVSAGTAEFLVDTSGGLHFVSITPRLQVGHVVSEMCTGLDIVEQQLRIAAGERLSTAVLRVQPSGHAVGARVYAVAETEGASREITSLRFPTVAPGALRIETSVGVGTTMSPQYDAFVAEVVCYGATRHQALLTLDRVLAETVIEPLQTNLAFLRAVLADESFRAGLYDVELTERLGG